MIAHNKLKNASYKNWIKEIPNEFTLLYFPILLLITVVREALFVPNGRSLSLLNYKMVINKPIPCQTCHI